MSSEALLDPIFFENTVLLNEGLQVLHEWEERNSISVNLKKTNVMKFRKGGHSRKTDTFKYGTEKVIMSSSYNYLGILWKSLYSTMTALVILNFVAIVT